jgi:hypothetical protein
MLIVLSWKVFVVLKMELIFMKSKINCKLLLKLLDVFNARVQKVKNSYHAKF